jgi:hypothetical protein
MKTETATRIVALLGGRSRPHVLSESEIHELAVRVRNELSRRGWTKEKAEDRHGVCLLRAFQYATVPTESPVGNWRAEQFVAAIGFESTDGVMLWNDAQERKAQDVFDALDAVINRTSPPPMDPLAGVVIEHISEATVQLIADELALV